MSERIARSMRLIRADCIEDAKRDDGKPLTGLFVGTHLGGIYAMIDAIAHAVEVLAAGSSAATEVAPRGAESPQEATGTND